MISEVVNFSRDLGNFNLHTIKRGIGTMLGHALCFVPGNFVLTVDGQVFKVSPDALSHQRLGIVARRYERSEIEILRRNFVKDDVIIEIGAHHGILSRYAFLEKLHPGGMYVCVEPNPVSHDALSFNMQWGKRLHPSKEFRILNVAICDPEDAGKNVDFYVRNGLGSRLVYSKYPDDHETTIQVPTMSFGNLIGKLAPFGASVICDAEGAEIFMLKEPEAFGRVRQMIIELHEPHRTGQPDTPMVMLSKLEKLGFRAKDQADNVYYLTHDPS